MLSYLVNGISYQTDLYCITEMHKYTDKNSTDYRNLELAQSELKQVTTHINEDKRIADGRMELFEIMNNINNCPVSRPTREEVY